MNSLRVRVGWGVRARDATRAVAGAAPAAAAVATPAGAFEPGGPAPPACSDPSFAIQVGTLGDDFIDGSRAPAARIYGQHGDDWLFGSAGWLSCLFGGPGDDVLTLGAGGGIVEGEAGADALDGGPAGDGLSGGAGPDVLAPACPSRSGCLLPRPLEPVVRVTWRVR